MALWLVATPIGTLSDLSPRAREVLGSVPVIVAEDTRSTRKLLGAVDIPAPKLVAVHAHNEDRKAAEIARWAAEGEVALVSDAGMPAISDPGRSVVAACHAAGVDVRCVPGPSALGSAVALSGFPAAPMTFLGFAPRKGREGWVRRAAARAETLAIFEAPTRVASLVQLWAEVAPHREGCLCREISKRYEEVVRAPLQELADNLAARETLKGECVLVIGPGEAVTEERADLAASSSLKQIAAALAERWGVSKKEAYQRLIRLEDED